MKRHRSQDKLNEDLEELGRFKGVLLHNTVNQSAPISTDLVIVYDTQVYDTDNFWDSGVTSKITIPAGITKVKLSARVVFGDNQVGDRTVSIAKNGSVSYAGLPRSTTTPTSAGFHSMLIDTPVLEVTEGDYFQLIANQTSDVTLSIVHGEIQSWFALQVVG